MLDFSNFLPFSIIIPFLMGVICLFIPRRLKRVSETIALLTAVMTFCLTSFLFLKKPLDYTWEAFPIVNLHLDNLSGFILPFVGLFGVLIVLYSLGFMKGKERLNEYYAYILWTIGATLGAILSPNSLLFLIFWGLAGLTLYLLIGLGGPEAAEAAKKTFIIVGGADCLLILGLGIIWSKTQGLNLVGLNLNLGEPIMILSFLSLLAAALAKAGAIPLHTWIPDSSEVAPTSVMAFLPASLDKLLGIYFLTRICLDMFKIKIGSSMFYLLMIIGAVTIISAVMMALIQHNLKKLLAYHAVSQVGYMVLGVGTGLPIGIVGGLFHMINHAIYKSCLFLTAGGVEKKVKTTDLNKLGGLSRFMPLTFISAFIAALAISGVPPFNGFVSKWLIYQGIIELGSQGDKFWIIWLVVAVFGSALTLASFMKLIHAVFLGQPSPEQKPPPKEVNWTMWLPMVILAGLCLFFGLFAVQIPLKYFINPTVGGEIIPLGFWNPSLATGLIILGVAIGFIIYLLGKLDLARSDESYVGGEIIPAETRVTGVDFYQTISDIKLFKIIYRKAEAKFFDIYEQGKNLTFFISKGLRKVHSGILTTYLIWCFLGMIVLFTILLR